MRHTIFAAVIVPVLTLGLSLSSTPAQAAKIVRWVDAEGITHFGNSPPPSQLNAEEIDVQPANRLAIPTSSVNSDIARDLQSSKSPARAPRSVVLANKTKQATSPAKTPSKPRKKRSW